MHFKDLKLGTKLAIGFGVLILISVLLGGMAVLNMSRITNESEALAHEYVPEVKIATNLRGAANRVMYEMRGYGLSEEKEYYDEALKEIDALKNSITEGENLSKEAKRLVKLAEELKVANSATDKYLALVEQTSDINGSLNKAREKMDESAGLYMLNCKKYQARQYEVMAKEILSGSTNSARFKKVSLINEIIDDGNSIRVGNFKSQATRDPAIFQSALNKFPSVFELLNDIRSYTKVDADIVALDNIEKEAKDYQEAMNTFINDWLEREKVAKEREEAGRELITACAETADAGLAGTQHIANEAITLLSRSNKAMVSGLIVALLIGIAFAMFLTRAITVPVNKGVIFAQKLAEGDLTVTIDVNQKDEIGVLANALSGMGSRLRSIVEEILTGANNIASASQQMSSTSQEMSQGANEQASSVEEVTSSMEEMAANIQQNTESALTTEKIALGAAKEIRIGSDATNTAVESMKNIAEKIQIINDIAFQTNILALNAAVEAARAGEHGRGFAVVAAEVRKLAEHSKVAASEIDDLSKNGVNISEQAGTKLTEIVPEIERTAQLVQEIAAASQEQTTGADQVNNAMQQLNNVTQQNASASEELASASEELASQAEKLKEIISYFKTGNQYDYSLKSKFKLNGNGTSAKSTLNVKKDYQEIAMSDAIESDEFENF